MLVTKKEVFKRFWYPVVPICQMSEQPQSFELLGQKLVLWLNEDGTAVVASDRCCHRSAQLSKGKVVEGNIVQFCLRNDTEAETKAKDVIAFDRAKTLEDKAVLETTDYDVPLDLKQEQHIMMDKPGILIIKN